jgi:uncharacterized protein (TIGR02099 family)
MVKKSLLLGYRIALVLLSITAATLILGALAIQFLIFPNIDQYKDNIANFASTAAKQKIVIGNIKVGWQGLNPHLAVSNIDIYDVENRPALQLKNTDVSLSWLSIPLMEPRLANLTIRSPELTIRRTSNGDIFVAGISMQGPSKPDLPNWLLRQTQFEVLNAKVIWLDEMRAAPALSLDKLNLQVISPPWKSLVKNHRFLISTIPSIGTLEPIVISGNVYGNDITQLAQWHGSIDATLSKTNLVAYKPWIDYSVLMHAIDLQSGIGSANIKIQFAKSQVHSIASKLALDNVQMHFNTNIEPVILNKFAGELNWENEALQQNFSANHLTLTTNNDLRLDDSSVNYVNNQQGLDSLNIKLTHIDLASIKPYLAQLPLPAEVMEKIVNLSPTGSLDNLTLAWQGQQATTKTYQIDAKFNELSALPYQKIPGFKNLTGEISANQSSGKVTLNTLNAGLYFKDTLRWPIPVNQLDGDITWNMNGQETNVKVNDLNFRNQHLSSTTNAEYVINAKKGDSIDLTTQLTNADAKYALFYYPINLGKTTLHWLDTSILSGRLENVNVNVKGRLADFPFVDAKNKPNPKLGVFKVTGKLAGSEIEYGIGWPNIEGLNVDMLFEGKRMELNANAGHLFGNQLTKSKITIPQLDAAEPILNITSEFKSPVTEAIKFVNKSPVLEVTQGFTEDLNSSGQGKLNLNLMIPMQNLELAKYKGQYQVINGTIDTPDIPELSGINGLLEFTESSLTAKNINANAFGTPLTFSLTTGKDKQIRIVAKGKVNDAGIKKMLIAESASPEHANRLAKGANYFAGSTNWTSEITIQKPLVNIAINSDLVGLSSRLPIPFKKPGNEHLNLRITKNQTLNSDNVSLSLGNRFAAKITHIAENGQMKFDRGSVRFNTNPINGNATNPNDLNANLELGKTKGLQVYGNIDYLDADAWRRVMYDFSNGSSQESPPIQKLALKINMLDIFDRRINQLRITNNADKEGLRATIESREFSGDLQWLNQNNGKFIARLSHLSLPEEAPNKFKPSNNDMVSKDVGNQEQEYPALDIIAENFEFNKKNLGTLELIASPQNNNWSIQKLKLSNADSSITADGQWNNWKKNPSTYLNVTWDIKNLGKTLKNVGYPDVIKNGEGTLTGQLQWAGSPYQFNPIELNGNLQLSMKKGQILKVQPGVGRLLGLLSLQSLPRRLSLDFRDLFSNGFAFDKINATAKINDGIMSSDDFLMAGPAAEVTIKGETNLQKETQRLTVKVLPRVSDSLSLAALAGGPLVGAVAFLAQKILKDPLNKIASTEYEIIGTWDNPQEVKTNKNNEETINQSPLNQ